MTSQPLAWKLWHPVNGVQFTVPRRDPLYPHLDISHLHTSATALMFQDVSNAAPGISPKSGHGDLKEAGILQTADSHAVAGKVADGQSRPGENLEVAKLKPDEEEAESKEDPPFIPLSYKMTKEAFKAARSAKPGSPASFWSYTQYRGPCPDGKGEEVKVKVHYCRSKHTTERVCQYFLKEKVIGFDLEWCADATKAQGPRRNVCLAQMASESRIALFHISLYPKTDDLVAPSFRKIMEDPTISKAGVWIKGDCTRLRTYLGIQAKGQFELSNLYKLVRYSGTEQEALINKRLVPLATIVQDHLRLPMFKGQDVRSSDWSKPLRMDQIICKFLSRKYEGSVLTNC
jgi:exonuclease 3'-5' domain-containing protein 2